MAGTPESKLASRVIERLERAFPGSTWWKNPAGMGRTVGMPDIAGVVKGRACAFEVKMPLKQPTRIQRYRLGRLRASGAVAYVVWDPTEAVAAIVASGAAQEASAG